MMDANEVCETNYNKNISKNTIQGDMNDNYYGSKYVTMSTMSTIYDEIDPKVEGPPQSGDRMSSMNEMLPYAGKTSSSLLKLMTVLSLRLSHQRSLM